MPAKSPGASVQKTFSRPALQVEQWLSEWEDVDFSPAKKRREPPHHFLLFSLSATTLRSLSGIARRSVATGKRRAEDFNIQRAHEEERSSKIREYVRYGLPWSDLSKRQRSTDRYENLRNPGWLPTAVVVNILTTGDKRGKKTVDKRDLVSVSSASKDSIAQVEFPTWAREGKEAFGDLPPLEVIDGQHRLWAFETDPMKEPYELPVVAFVGLDQTWQAYLFWTINIKPKKINPSLAFDLYPVLRTQDWLVTYEGPAIYREARAQELTELLWSYPESPWYRRINMLGDRNNKQVTQAAWIRNLIATFVRPAEGRGVRGGVGGLFGAPVGSNELLLPWNKAQQAAFLVYSWQSMERAIQGTKLSWAQVLRAADAQQGFALDSEEELDSAFAGSNTLLNTDQGVRAFLAVMNDLFFIWSDQIGLQDWVVEEVAETVDSDLLDETIAALEEGTEIDAWVDAVTDALASFDWRTSGAPKLEPDQRTLKAAFRGSGGYRELRRQLLVHLSNDKKDEDVQTGATELLERLAL